MHKILLNFCSGLGPLVSVATFLTTFAFTPVLI